MNRFQAACCTPVASDQAKRAFCFIAAFVAVCGLFLLCGSAFGAEPGNDELWTGADARIEKHRKADLDVAVVDASGKPVAGATVKLEQTRHAFGFGSNIYMWGRCGEEKLEAAYRQRYAELFNYATLAFYWWSYERKQGEPSHERTERIARWCGEHGIATKGHPLMWNRWDPPWAPNDPDELRKLQLARIDDCVSRFRGLIDRWDVVNEAAAFDRKHVVKEAPRMSAMWKEAGRMELTRDCFEEARRANPKATLLINDYVVTSAYEKVIEQLVNASGKPLYDVIGIQSHMHGGAWSNRRIWDVCTRFERFGVPLHFTETTILSGKRGWDRSKIGPKWPSTPDGEQYQAREVVRVYTMLFSHPAVEAVTWWDFSDRGAWKSAPAGFLRHDMSPKPAYDELMKLIKGKWWTRAEKKTSDVGTAALRGFLGEYKLTVSVDGKADVEKTLTLGKGKSNRVSVSLP